MSKNKRIKVMINRSRKDKFPAGSSRSEWYRYNSAFKLEEITVHDFAAAIYNGYAFHPVFSSVPRRKENFVEAWHVAVDFDTCDSRSSLETLSSGPYSSLAAFAYSTPSSTPEAPKSRLVWILDAPITDRERYEKLFHGLVAAYPAADQSVKDVARLFYGSEGAEFWVNWAVLDSATVDEIVRKYEESLPVEKERSQQVMGVRLSDIALVGDFLLDTLRSAVDGEKHSVLNKVAYTFGGYIANGYFSRSAVEGWLMSIVDEMPNVRSRDDAYRTVLDAIRDGEKKPLIIEPRTSKAPMVYEPPRDIIVPETVTALNPSQAYEQGYLDGHFRGYHDRMSAEQRLLWERLLPQDAIDIFGLGYRPAIIDKETGEIVSDAALTVPYRDGSQLLNVEYRTDKSVSYESEKPSIFSVTDEIDDRPAIVFLDTLHAMRCSLPMYGNVSGLGGERAQFLATPQCGIDRQCFDQLKECREVFVVCVGNEGANNPNLGYLRRLGKAVNLLALPKTADQLERAIRQARA